ncbi:PAAR-like domain-containing protein [Oryzifoliimicrobium ureilyticus]|uniref:PAAR-like domain-containing protein n=1 Tax=Oryzifoliimicrobium ureilyticus TaxID=3113724 RepID=UPI00307604EA
MSGGAASANHQGYVNVDVTAEARATNAITRNGLVEDQPVLWNQRGNYFYQFKNPNDLDSVVEFNDTELEKKLRDSKGSKAGRPPAPTAANPPPPELIPDDSTAIAVCLSPDFCRAPDKVIPFPTWGKASDKSEYSPNVRSNGKLIKRQNSTFSCCYGDEPGVGLGVKSGTVGGVVKPVTSSPIVFANGVPVQRHSDRCTLNNGNCPGEYINVKSTSVYDPPDGDDKQNRSGFSKAWDGFYENSDEAQLVGGALSKGQEYWQDPSKIGSDLKSAWDARPSVSDVEEFGENVAHGVGNTAKYVWNNPVQSAENVATWTGDAVKGLWTGVTDAYDKGGVLQAGGHLAAVAVGVINPFKKAKLAGELIEGAEKLGDIAKVEHRAKEAVDAARKAKEGKKAEEALGEAKTAGDEGTRSTRKDLKKTIYKRPSGFRKGVRKKVWEDARGPDGKIRDPLTGREMNENEPWDMGHKPGYEFRKAQENAIDKNYSRSQFLDEYNDPSHYRPELPSSNRSHAGEDMTDTYLGK